MLGTHIGKLNVLLNETVVISVKGDQGWKWKMAQVKLNASQSKVSYNRSSVSLQGHGQ